MNSSPTDTTTPSPHGLLLAEAGLSVDSLRAAGFRIADLVIGLVDSVLAAGGVGWPWVHADVEKHDRRIAAANDRTMKFSAGTP